MAFRVLSFINSCKEFIQIITINLKTPTNNQRVYESDDVVTYYTEQGSLQEPEATILDKFRNILPQMRMLDIGVGAGRTTSYFAVLAKEYLGIDYSYKMTNACQKKFGNYSQRISFMTVDARTMELFKDNSFDFVLFSFNGIDYMEHEERIRTLREIRRIINMGGYFCFSTHNLNFLLKNCSIQLSKHPIIFATRVFQLMRMRLLNKKAAWKAIRSSSRNARHTMVNDGAMDLRLKTYYITPVEQLKQLSELGYTNTKMYSLTNGREITNLSEATDHWVYYLCRNSWKRSGF